MLPDGNHDANHRRESWLLPSAKCREEGRRCCGHNRGGCWKFKPNPPMPSLAGSSPLWGPLPRSHWVKWFPRSWRCWAGGCSPVAVSGENTLLPCCTLSQIGVGRGGFLLIPSRPGGPHPESECRFPGYVWSPATHTRQPPGPFFGGGLGAGGRVGRAGKRKTSFG